MKPKTGMVTILVFSFLLAGLFLSPLLAAEGMKVSMKVDGMI
jgi:hypothetical protein